MRWTNPRFEADLMYGKYKATAPSYTDGQTQEWRRLNSAGAELVAMDGTGVNAAASTYYNATVSADVDAAVAAVAGLRLIGFSVRETAGATASLRIVNGATGAAAGKVQVINLAANESTGDWFGPDGIACASGISVDWVSGAFEITLHHKTTV